MLLPRAPFSPLRGTLSSGSTRQVNPNYLEKGTEGWRGTVVGSRAYPRDLPGASPRDGNALPPRPKCPANARGSVLRVLNSNVGGRGRPEIATRAPRGSARASVEDVTRRAYRPCTCEVCPRGEKGDTEKKRKNGTRGDRGPRADLLRVRRVRLRAYRRGSVRLVRKVRIFCAHLTCLFFFLSLSLSFCELSQVSAVTSGLRVPGRG